MCDQREKLISDLKYWAGRCQQAEQQRDRYRVILELSSGIFRNDVNLVYPHAPLDWANKANQFMARTFDFYNYLVLPELEPTVVDLTVPWMKAKHDEVLANMQAHAYDFSKETKDGST